MSVEFLPEDGDEPPLPPPAARSRRRAGWVVLALLVVAAATTWALTHTSGGPPAAVGSSPLPAPVTPTPIDPACRGVPACAIDTSVSPALRALARRYLPAGSEVSVHTVVSVSSLTQEQLLIERDVRASVGSTTVLVRAQRGAVASEPISADPPGVGSLLIHTSADGFVIRLQYLAPETVPPQLARLRAFIADPVLLATSGP